eukprot:gene35979-43635_t
MRRNIVCQSSFQLVLLLVLLFKGAEYFNVHEGEVCAHYDVKKSTTLWNVNTLEEDPNGTIGCPTFKDYCSGSSADYDCYTDNRLFPGATEEHSFSDYHDYGSTCLDCTKLDYTHSTIIFNTFIFCQVFNEYTSRNLFDEWNPFKNILSNYVFLCVSMVTIGLQIILVEFGGDFLETTPLSSTQWLITVALGAIGLPIGVLMRFIPIKEDPASFFDNSRHLPDEASASLSPNPAVRLGHIEVVNKDLTAALMPK